LRSLTRAAIGFDPDQVLTFSVSVPGSIADEQRRLNAFQDRLVDVLQTIPGVDAVGFANHLPLDGCCLSTVVYPERGDGDRTGTQRTSFMAVSPGYFSAMRMRVQRGRRLSARDVSDALAFVVINETAARHYWPAHDPIGEYGRFGTPNGSRFQVVGVVDDVKNDGLGNPTVPEVFVPSAMARVESMNVVMRSSRPAAALLPEIRRAVRSIDREQPIHEESTMRDIVDRSTTLERVSSVVTGMFAGAALLMAMLGVFGAVSYAVRLRTMEIGTRMALGATNSSVLWLVVRDGLLMAALGVVSGGAAAIAAVVYLSRTFNVNAISAAPFLYAVTIVGIVALVASSAPAWRAAALSPMSAMRDDGR
jgi:putative ABC transport system permease protein